MPFPAHRIGCLAGSRPTPTSPKISEGHFLLSPAPGSAPLSFQRLQTTRQPSSVFVILVHATHIHLSNFSRRWKRTHAASILILQFSSLSFRGSDLRSRERWISPTILIRKWPLLIFHVHTRGIFGWSSVYYIWEDTPKAHTGRTAFALARACAGGHSLRFRYVRGF